MNVDLLLKTYLSDLKNLDVKYIDYYKMVLLLSKIYANNEDELKELICIGNLVTSNILNIFSDFLQNKDLLCFVELAVLVEYSYYFSEKELDEINTVNNNCFNKLTEIDYRITDLKIDINNVISKLSDFEKKYIFYKYGFYDGYVHSTRECFNEFNIERNYAKSFDKRLLKKIRNIYFE